MTPILSMAGREAVLEIARGRALLALDFDGTLAPIVPDRNAARVRSDTAGLLRTAALMYPCAVVSGRSRGDVASRLPRVPLVAVIGNHGAEAAFGPLDRGLERQVAAWHGPLSDALAATQGVDVEDKYFSIAVHYRAAPSWDLARRRILDAAARLGNVRIFDGHAVVNLVPADAPTKADALEDLSRRLGARAVAYVGDDATDEEAFRSGAVTYPVRIGHGRETAARFALPDQAAIDDLLRALIAARAQQDGLGARWEGLVRVMG
ncbi:trehalose-phosphatase [Anaeromyxobacter oryzae]|uniref:Trehalose 6-phosphate phosphatase n=1 Tax=Anaeromyxobacter oryzae TaxID=2918170 RepID=A0ABM7WS50_9BACT|nr:trehalose-phosphatase [Anaeromyxobacter oryzae]BDG02309.1 trehalose 6-phosphate phosphatase [Anaeromyxobacter oryzae]